MTLTALDGAIVAAYFLVSIGIGMKFTKKGGESLEEYFVAGRRVSWWLAGSAMIATTFAADTPLVVTGLVAAHGVAGNWLWWNMVMSGTLTVFLYARLWRRARVMTDVELAELRYGGAPATFLRAMRALYLALPINLIILGWVTLAMVKILQIALGVKPYAAVGICFAITVLYSAAAGMWAVLWTDLVQLVIKMTAVIALAVFAVRAVGGLAALKTGLAAHFGSERAALSVVPPAGSVWMPTLAVVTFLAVQWWAAWYPGAEPGGGGYVAQRIFSARTERDGVLATLFFNVGHYALRPWPWIVTGLCTVLLYPGGVLVNGHMDKEGAYVKAMVDLMPAGWKGFMLAGFAAAYMSTVGTHLNWGASYLVNDVYRRFLKKGASERHYVNVSRLATVALFLLSILVTANLSTIESAWRFLLALGSGTGLVLILRWYWWRINAWSEISAMVASAAVSLTAFALIKNPYAAADPRFSGEELRIQALVMLVTVAVSTAVWLAATFATRPESDEKLEAFYTRVRPGGPGWARVSRRLGLGVEEIPGGALSFLNWFLGVVLVYASLFGIGQVVFGRLAEGLAILALALAAFALILRNLRRDEGGAISKPAAAACLALLLAAPVLHAHGDVHDQIAALTLRLRAEPRNAELFLKRGELHRVHGDVEAALADFRAAAAIDPTLEAADLCAARALLKGKRPAEAAARIERVLACRPNDPEALLLRARAASALGETERAAALYPLALDASARPEPDLYVEAARALSAGGRESDALATLERGLVRLGAVPALELGALDFEVSLARTDAALARLDRLASSSSRPETWLLRRAEVLERSGRRAEARTAYGDALRALEALPARLRGTRAAAALDESVRAGLVRTGGN
jgi:SSS family solute:Na+ symporter